MFLLTSKHFLKNQTVNPATKLSLLNFIDDLLGLQLIDRANKLRATESAAAPAEIQELAEKRAEAKKNRDFATADELRGKIDAAGWTVMDIPGGFKLVQKG